METYLTNGRFGKSFFFPQKLKEHLRGTLSVLDNISNMLE